MVKPVVRIDDLRLEFLSQAGPFEALKGISLDINEGEIVGGRRRIRFRQVRDSDELAAATATHQNQCADR